MGHRGDGLDVYFVVQKMPDGSEDWVGGTTGDKFGGFEAEVCFALGDRRTAEKFRQWLSRERGVSPDDLEVVRFSRCD